jgi:hypothetical protein
LKALFFKSILVLAICSFLLPHGFCQEVWVQTRDSNTGISFPEFLGGMQRGEITDFEAKKKGLGIGIRFAGAKLIKADVYQDGPHSEEMTAEFKKNEREIYSMEKAGKYQAVKKISEAETVFGNSASVSKALSSIFSYTQDGINRVSHTYLTGYHNKFLKIRFTYPTDQTTEAEKIRLHFIQEVGALLGNQKQ